MSFLEYCLQDTKCLLNTYHNQDTLTRITIKTVLNLILQLYWTCTISILSNLWTTGPDHSKNSSLVKTSARQGMWVNSCMLTPYLAQKVKKFVSKDLQFGWIYLVFSLLLFGSFFHDLVRNMFKQHLTSSANLQKRKKFNTEASPRHSSFYLISACTRRALHESYFLNDKRQMEKKGIK